LAVIVNHADVSGVTPYILVCGRLQDWVATLRKIIVCSSETSVNLYIITQRRILEATVFIHKIFLFVLLDCSFCFCSCV